MGAPISPVWEFHVSRKARDQYQFDETFFATNGNVIFTNFHAVRSFAQKMNQGRDLLHYPERAVRAGDLNAMGLIDEILHMVIANYRQQHRPTIMQEALDWLYGMLGQDEIDTVLLRFIEEFPPLAVYQRRIDPYSYLNSTSEGIPNRHVALEELLMLWLANVNPAFSPYKELFDDSTLAHSTVYNRIFPLLHAFFDTQPTAGADNLNLIDLLRAPALTNPHSLTGQLEFMRQRWSIFLGKYLYRLLSSLDLIKEEHKAIFTGPGPAHVIEYAGLELEPERFSEDKDWMPRLVLLAKNAYVWLDQLSKKYERPITHLDQIPDEELDTLARWGVSGLWLIGLWERSQASETIKKLRGNPDAVASAYSLFDYSVAAALGGDEGYQNLRDRAWKRGIRLASDMVPNHMGIDSRWVMEHPDWFLSLDYSPFPSYTFNGTNLSWDQRVGIYLEDHYYNNSDAAVVFKRVDFWTGSSKYIYHGNDGTSMPWNDTAQLNYLLPEVREAVIQTILHVARKFPIIRFDAAMTLAKKHFQRLWFPEPGSGGDIASRSDHALPKEQFDQAIPVEFWREVVDRVAQEVPDTLLLAEAFWLMEGYFVRTLGMHRVYNSAFMNMLRDEKNAEYRLGIKNTLDFDPDILKRYVNFMNNPDERTAVDQFGKGDKYFGVCMLMNTLPGLPMLGHGQIEGFTEKYGMEYRKAYWDEQVDGYLVERHERDIFPIMRKRYLFAGSDNFLLYDVHAPDGSVIEDVYAFSNQAGGEHSLVLYHNKFATARGWIHTSAPYTIKHADGSKTSATRTLAQGLDLQDDPEMFTILRDQISGLEIIRNNRELIERGLYVELDAYKYRVYMDIRQVRDNQWHQYAHVAAYLGGGGVPSIEDAVKEIFLAPVHTPYRELINAGSLSWLILNRSTPLGEAQTALVALEEADTKMVNLVSAVQALLDKPGDPAEIALSVRRKLSALLRLPTLNEQRPTEELAYQAAVRYLLEIPEKPVEKSTEKPAEKPGRGKLSAGAPASWGTLLAWLFTHPLGEVQSATEAGEISRTWIDEWMLGRIISAALQDMQLSETEAWRSVGMVRILTRHHTWWQSIPAPDAPEKPAEAALETAPTAAGVLRAWLSDRDVQAFLNMNRYQDVLWYNKEAFDDLLWWLFVTAIIDLTAAELEPQISKATLQKIITCFGVIQHLHQAEQESAYQVEKLLNALKN